MANFDFSKVVKSKSRPVDPEWANPVNFFYKLDHPDIKDLFPVQHAILRKWFLEFKKSINDKMVSLNTGGGKTLVGLLIAESIRRETGGKVVYICPNTFLGKQTSDEAAKYGLKVASYLRRDLDRPSWSNETDFLENNAICITTYSALLNPRSIFKEMEIKGVIFDDAHLSLNLLDEQFFVRSEDARLIKNITDIFKSSPHIREKIDDIQNGEPTALIMIPPIEWHQQSETIKDILTKNEEINGSLSWMNIREKLDRTFCFVSAHRVEIGLLYPDVKNHYIFHNSVHRVYLSATLPNLDDLTRVFGVTPTRIQVENPDYRPQRLFIFAKKTKLNDPESIIRTELLKISPKNLVLTPSNDALVPYGMLGALIPGSSGEVPSKIQEFKNAESGILALANRYDGIDMPGKTCHSLVIDGLPYAGNLKTRFFSEYFHNHKNSFMRSIMASKLIQAFGRTIRANNDFSIIFLLGGKLNSWVINRDNQRFFRSDLYEDIKIGLNVSESITSIEDLRNLSNEILSQTDEWKTFFEERKNLACLAQPLSTEEESGNVLVAQKERKIHELFMSGSFRACLELILASEMELAEYSKPILGLYLSIAAICCIKTSDERAEKLSGRAYGINPIFGAPVSIGGKQTTMQAQRILDLKSSIPEFDWSITGKAFDENLKKLGEFLGFSARRPEAEGEGTLDVCWADEEKKVVLGFENKVEKINKILSKQEIGQCSEHLNWIRENYFGYEINLFVVGELVRYNELASPPPELYHCAVTDIQKISAKVLQVYAKKVLPEQVDPSLDSQNLRIGQLFCRNKVSELKSVGFN
ncbi:MAG: helicase C-terminal domain-containing protein [Patescibacteria group bacterium]|nr:helicase C-terminal domain-containing protein [Patescibacteria group bacterium]